MYFVEFHIYVHTSCKYLSSGRSKLLSRPCGPLSVRHIYCASRSIYYLSPSGLCPAEVRIFISIHQVAPATVLLLLLLLRACFIVVCQVSLT